MKQAASHGTYFVGWLDGATGGPDVSFMLLAACLVAAGLLTLLVRPLSGRPGTSTGAPSGRTRAETARP